MKRILLVIFIFILLCPIGLAETQLDFASMSNDELHTMIDLARNELTKREMHIGDSIVILDAQDVVISLTGEYRTSSDSEYLDLNSIVVNNSSHNVGISLDHVSVNGWSIYGSAPSDVDAGKKGKDEFTFNLDEADCDSIEKVEDIEFVIVLYDSDSYDTLYTSDLIHLQMQ